MWDAEASMWAVASSNCTVEASMWIVTVTMWDFAASMWAVTGEEREQRQGMKTGNQEKGPK